MRNPFKSEASRKFIDLIHDASTNWANWDPSHKIEPGDFGTIDSKTGQFEKHDNIYVNEQTSDIAKPYPPVRGEGKTYKQVVSKNVKSAEFDLNPKVDVVGIAEASIKTQWGFTSSRGAVLIMHNPQTSYLPGELLQKIVESRVDCLRGKMIITDVSSCPSYSMYLSAGGKESVKIALLASVPVVSPGISAGGGISAGWWSSSNSGIFEHAHKPGASFFPLYASKTLKAKARRGSPGTDNADEDFLAETDAPWNPLDEDGNEVVFEDDDDEDEDEEEDA